MNDPKVIVALDFDQLNNAEAFVEKLKPELCKLKVGKEMFTHFGPQFVKDLVQKGYDVFLDLKFHDIPNTVAKACIAAADLGVWMCNVHASGGPKMMEAAKQAIDKNGGHIPKLIAVTVLTSMDNDQLRSIGISHDAQDQVLKLAKLTNASGLDGVVCSAQEAVMLRSEIGESFQLVTPGIRPLGSDKGDQSRVMTPVEAMNAGVSYMVIGRPITKADDPLDALHQINASIKQ